MKKKIKKVFGCIAAMALIITPAFSYIAAANTKGAYPLNKNQIKKIISGKKITPHIDNNGASLPFGEFFYTDYKWAGTLQSYAFSTVHGYWHIEANKVCVKILNGAMECRTLWKNKKQTSL